MVGRWIAAWAGGALIGIANGIAREATYGKRVGEQTAHGLSGLTVAFEFGFGRLVAKQSWHELLGDYDLRRGRTWPLVLAWIAVGPAVVRRLQ